MFTHIHIFAGRGVCICVHVKTQIETMCLPQTFFHLSFGFRVLVKCRPLSWSP